MPNEIREDEARLNITYAGENGDMLEAISRDAAEGDIRMWATEAVRAGTVPGIGTHPDADFTDFVVTRVAPTDAYPYHRVFLAPKTPFGCAA